MLTSNIGIFVYEEVLSGLEKLQSRFETILFTEKINATSCNSLS